MPKREAERIVLRLRSPLPVPLQKETYVPRLQKCPESGLPLERCGGTIDTRVAPNGYASFDGAVGSKPVQCKWLIRAREGERIKFRAFHHSLPRRSRCHVYNGKSSAAPPVWTKSRYSGTSVFILSTNSTLLVKCFVSLRFARGTSIRFWYSVVKSTGERFTIRSRDQF